MADPAEIKEKVKALHDVLSKPSVVAFMKALKAAAYQEPKPAHYRAIGRVIVMWNRLEYEMERAIWILVGFGPLTGSDDTGHALTIHIPFRVRMDIIRSLTACRVKDEKLKKELETILKDITDADVWRNLLAHNDVTYWRGLGATVRRVQARAGVSRKAYKLLTKQLDEVAVEMDKTRWQLEEWSAQAWMSFFRTSPQTSASQEPPGAHNPRRK